MSSESIPIISSYTIPNWEHISWDSVYASNVIKWAASKRQTETPYTANESDQYTRVTWQTRCITHEK